MYKNILSSTLPLLIVIILSVVLGNYGIGRVTGLQNQITQTRQDLTVLTQKLNILQSISSTVGTGSQAAAAALPEKNPAIATLSQIKSLAAQNILVISNLKSGGEIKNSSGFSEVSITFDVSGARSGVIAFLGSIAKIAPISVVDKIKLTETAGQTQATVTMRSFWASFPKNIPSTTEAISDLNQDEKNTLSKIGELTYPQFVEVPPQQSGGKADPFAQ